MNGKYSNGLGLWGHVWIGASLSNIVLFAFCFIMGGVPSDANGRFTLVGRLPIYAFHFAIPGIAIGIIVHNWRRCTKGRKNVPEPGVRR